MQVKHLLFATISFYLSLSPSCYARNGIIPAPVISASELTISPEQTLNITGSGFIKGLPNAHKVLLYNDETQFKLKIIQANADNLIAELPGNIRLGDYRSKIKIKSRLLKSPLTENPPLIRLRPRAPSVPKLHYPVASDNSELRALFKSLTYQGLPLKMHLPEDLAIGPNPVKFSYSINGFDSINSEAVNFYYLPQERMKPELAIDSTNPLQAYAESQEQKTDVTTITQSEQDSPLTSFYFLSTPKIQRYLLHSISLSPIFISSVHAGDPEFITIHNRNNLDFDLSNCTISDSLKARYTFVTGSKINPGMDLKLEVNLSLNNDGDTVSITCKDMVIDSFNYKSIDVDGYAIK